jgi:hypothetical protein
METVKEWLQSPERTTAEIVRFMRSACSEAAREQYCDSFEGDCQSCLESWLNSKWRG